MNKLSVTIITLNEERNIERCLKSLAGVADEIIVLDSFSSDRTEEICEQYDVIFEKRKWEGYSASKNYLNQLASHEYILSLDADESLSEELKNSILKEKNNGFSGVYSVNRLTNYCGTWIKYSGWYPDIKTRIFPKSISQWVGAYVHEELEVDGNPTPQLLIGDLFHYSYYSFIDHKERADKYSRLTAQKMNAKGKKASALKPYLSAFVRFVGMYFVKLGFLDGKMGFKIAQISAQSNIYKYKELRRLNREQDNKS